MATPIAAGLYDVLRQPGSLGADQVFAALDPDHASTFLNPYADARVLTSGIVTMLGMVFPAHRTTAGLLLLAELTDEELDAVYPADRPDLDRLRTELARVRRNGFVLNQGRSERGVVALGVPLRAPDGDALAGLSVSMPSGRYDRHRLPALVNALSRAAGAIEADLAVS